MDDAAVARMRPGKKMPMKPRIAVSTGDADMVLDARAARYTATVTSMKKCRNKRCHAHS